MSEKGPTYNDPPPQRKQNSVRDDTIFNLRSDDVYYSVFVGVDRSGTTVGRGLVADKNILGVQMCARTETSSLPDGPSMALEIRRRKTFFHERCPSTRGPADPHFLFDGGWWGRPVSTDAVCFSSKELPTLPLPGVVPLLPPDSCLHRHSSREFCQSGL